MELAGSNYLLALAAISVTFVSFSAVAVVFRQAQGAVLSPYETVFLRLFLASGLLATVFSLIPPLLGLFGITPAWVWRVSSLAFALVLLWRENAFMRRRRQVRPGPLPWVTYALYGISTVVVLGLLVNAIGLLGEPGVGLYALAATWLLVHAIVGFIIMLDVFLQPPKNS